MPSFEEACAGTESAAQAAIAAATALLSKARALSKAAHDGDVVKLRRTAEPLTRAADEADASAHAAAVAWPLTPEEEERLLATSYGEELIEAGRADGLEVRSQDDRLVASPSLLKVLPGPRAIQVDRKRMTTLRPSRVVALLKASQQKKPRLAPERFIETLHAAYGLVAGRNGSGGVALVDVYEALTLMPDVRRDYAHADFSRDIFVLDRSGVTETKQGARISFPTATGTKSARKLFTFVGPDGHYVTYYGIRFTRPEP